MHLIRPIGLIRRIRRVVTTTASVALAWMIAAPSWAAEYPRMYWSDRAADTIQRADADGSDVQVLVSGL